MSATRLWSKHLSVIFVTARDPRSHPRARAVMEPRHDGWPVEGSRVKARFGASTMGPAGTKFFLGVVTAVNSDSTFAVAYDDGDLEERVLIKYMKKSDAPLKERPDVGTSAPHAPPPVAPAPVAPAPVAAPPVAAPAAAPAKQVKRPKPAAPSKQVKRQKSDAVDAKSRPAAAEIEGVNIEVYWPEDEAFYVAVVTSFSAQTGQHEVEYIMDGVVEKLRLSDERWRIAKSGAVKASVALRDAQKAAAKAEANEPLARTVCSLPTTCVLEDVSLGLEEGAVPLLTVDSKPAEAAMGEGGSDQGRGEVGALAAKGSFTYILRNVNRTLIDDEGAMLDELLDRRHPDGLLPQVVVAERLRQCHAEADYLFKNRKRVAILTATGAMMGAMMCTETVAATSNADAGGVTELVGGDGGGGAAGGVETDSGGEVVNGTCVPDPSVTAPAVEYGCGKCRWSRGGCTRCRAPGFVPGPKEGRAGGIPQPGSETALAVAGCAGDGGGLLARVRVTDATPTCQQLHAAGLPAGLGLVSEQHIRAGDAVIEYVGEVLTREQHEAREAWYVRQGFACSYALFSDQHGYVIDATLYGNAARFMNASCEPNLKQGKMSHALAGSLPRILFKATRDIAPGEELTWRYLGLASAASRDAQAKAARCFCGSRKCRGFL